MSRMGIFLVVLGVIVYLIAGVLLVVKAFKVSVAWGLGSMFVPFVGFIFVAKHWDDTKHAFLAVLAGGLMIFLGAAVLPEKTTAPLVATTTGTDVAPASAMAGTPQPYTPPPSAYAPPPVAQTVPAAPAATVEEQPKRLVQVYADRETRLYYAEDCKKRPPNAYRVARSVAVMQGFTAAKCR
jgi:hypothetical protein